MNETVTRLATALVIAPVAVWLIAVGGWAWTAFLIAIAVTCEIEFFNLMEAKGFRPHRAVALSVTVALMAVAHLAGIELAAGMLTAGILGLLVAHLSRPSIGEVIPSISVTMAAVLYVGWLLSHGIYLRQLVASDGSDIGVFAVLLALVTTALSDSGAYFVGRQLGRHPIAPNISPKKTWEGLLGGVAAAGLGGVALKLGTELWFRPVPYGYAFLFVLGVGAGVVGFLGDLVESLLKRDADVKDSGKLLPGHGGFLDRIDGYLFTVPFTFYALTLAERLLNPPPHP